MLIVTSALAKGSQVLGSAYPEDSPYLKRATRAAEFVERELYDAATGVLASGPIVSGSSTMPDTNRFTRSTCSA